MSQTHRINHIFSKVRVLPVLTLNDIHDAVPLARVLCAAGLDVLEIVLRTPMALDAIRAITSELPRATVGAGTVLSGQHLEEALRAGARFAVSPGATTALYDAAEQMPIALLPAAVTGSEIMHGMERGYRHFKFFPAATYGGATALKALRGPFPEAHFCPTGGLDATSAAECLTLPNVFMVGGTWMVPAGLLRERNWVRIGELAAASAGL